MKKLPIGISTFSQMIEDNYYYVDKTGFVARLADQGKYYFLSRPRRFGKSLFLDTLKQAFSGNKMLFKGLYLEKNWDWNHRYPMISISFGGGVIQQPDALDQDIREKIEEIAENHNFRLKNTSIHGRFRELIIEMCKLHGQRVVILVDEYDKPLLDNITQTETALQIREKLKNLYSVIKDCDAYVRFCFVTGVSRFSRVSLFSGLNNLQDISLDPRYGTLCGYTETELNLTFDTLLKGLDRDRIRKWYNGYNFLSDKVYNPFDILLFLDRKDFGNYWFESATPSFLIKLMEQRRYYLPDLEQLEAGEHLLSSFDVDRILVETLLFQTGYLTIKSINQLGLRKVYILGFPNLEVQLSFTDYLLNHYVQNIPAKSKAQSLLYQAMFAADLKRVQQSLTSLFAAIPHDWYRKNNLDRYEGYFASVVYACFASIGFDLIAEDTTNHGQIDLTVFSENHIFIFEFKVTDLIEGSETAINQLKEKEYHEKYRIQKKPIYLIGIDFSRKKRNITQFNWEKVVES